MKLKPIFNIIKKSVTWYVIICILCAVIAFALCYFCNIHTNNITLFVFKDISVIIATTFGVSLLIGLLIEKNSKEDFYSELVKDAINSPMFQKRLTEGEKTKVCEDLNKAFRCKNNLPLYSIYSNLEKRFVARDFLSDSYYLDECKYTIDCKIKDGYIEKNCTKTMYFKSYSENFTLPELQLGVYRNKYYGDKECFELDSVSINNKTLSLSEKEKYVVQETLSSDEYDGPLLSKNEYNNVRCYKYKQKIKMTNKSQTMISYNYTTRTDANDDYLIVRCSKPCKNFSVDFKIDNPAYTVKAAAFGFIDHAGQSPNNRCNRQQVYVEFRQWILPDDGIVIMVNRI